MEGHCTCGARLVEDALFCHRCGRPVRELIPADDEPVEHVQLDEPPPPPPPLVLEPQPISLRNGAAVRTGLVAAALVQLASTLSAAAGASLLMPLIVLAGGFYAVILYSRRTGQLLTVTNGARIGWITGIFSFVITTVFFTVGIALLSGSDQLLKAYQDSASSLGLPPESAGQIQKLLADPASFAASIVLGLAFQFVLLTALCSMGGALGARFSARR